MKEKLLSVLCIALVCLTACRVPTEVSEMPPSSDGDAFVRAIWIPYMEVSALIASEDPVICRESIASCLEDCASRGANTVYLHVRANSDAYYASEVYPPTAATAALLEKGFDPLRVATEEAERLGLSLHAWVNPYRIGTDPSRAVTEDAFAFGERYYYVPTADSTHALVTEGVRELVERYEIDGVQFDDYFYPAGAVDEQTPAAFETADFSAYQTAGGALCVADWRRAQVSRLIAAVYSICHTRENVVFGVSPAYDIAAVRDRMYADVEEWASTAGYVDYLCPQLYFGFEHEYAPFDEALAVWDTLPRHGDVELIAGLALYKTGLAEDTYAGCGKAEWATGGDIIARQLQAVSDAHWHGAALYSHLSFEAEEGRDASVVEREGANACDAWRDMKSKK